MKFFPHSFFAPLATTFLAVSQAFRIFYECIKYELVKYKLFNKEPHKPSRSGLSIKILLHSFICGCIFITSFYFVVKKIELDDIKSAHFWAICSFCVPLCYLLLFWIFSVCRNKTTSIRCNTSNPVKKLKSNQQIFIEKCLAFYENQRLQNDINRRLLSESERLHTIQFPVLGLKGTTTQLFHQRDCTSSLRDEGISGWIFYDANARLVQPDIVPPLTGWRKRLQNHYLGKYLFEQPQNGWIWFHLKHPVEFHTNKNQLLSHFTNNGDRAI